jgi:hypothetical protein
MNVLAIKLVTGEDVLGEEILGAGGVTLKNPVGITIVRGKDGQPNVGFSPFPLHAEQKKDSTVAFPASHIVYSYTPSEDFISNYNQIFGSGIILPTKQLIT